MPLPTALLQLVGQAVFAAQQGSILDDTSVAASPELAEAVWADWARRRDEAARRQEIQALAAAPADEVEQAVGEVVEDLAGGRPAEVVIGYLIHVPAAIRRRLRRPADPAGLTVPTWLSLREPADLLSLLPARLPWLSLGDRPWDVGDWELVELRETGGLIEAWKARSPRQSDAPPALLKFCLHPAADQRLLQTGPGSAAATLERVLQEARHPGLLELRRVHWNANPPCLEYELFEAGDLAGLVRDWHSVPGPAIPALAATLVLQLARTLGQLHRLAPPLVHRGLTPARVLVRQAADGSFSCKIADLGLAELTAATTAEEDRRRTTRGPAMGNGPEDARLYASPEQQRGEPPDPRDDVYALGVLWYQMLSGNLAAGRPGGSQWRRRLTDSGVAAALVELLETCFEDDPAYRPVDAAVLAERLEPLLAAGEPSRAVPIARRVRTLPVEDVPAAPAAAAPPRPRARRADVQQLFESLEQKGPELAKLLTNSVGLKLVLIPAGSFHIGAADEETGRRDNESPRHEVALSRPFYLGVYPVTQEQYERVMGGNPSRFKHESGGGPEHPVENVTWEEAVDFCRRLSEQPAEKQAGRSYRLPTEAEWEYACRAGTTSAFCYGSSLSAAQANIDGRFPHGGAAPGRCLEKTTRVGSYPANNFGLYDVHGNVWEWCGDWLDSLYYGRSPRRDPQGPAAGQFRVLRGGSWRNHAVTCRAAYRNGLKPRARDSCTGFRVALDAVGS